ncbi:mRNA 3 end-processing YTH1 [Fusarium heterosporum]|uniref:mRNA 3 end-processing YTH1 n=1 Tax=Fusarium heterosporum TaxID=42747 RepID=A0A8H5WR18_FUSHE|nr:mRNA 3 end-processing YTH1 [Fusarium heterosporum]
MSTVDNPLLVADDSVIDDQDSGREEEHPINHVEYNIPNDDQENERLDLQHGLFLRTFDGKLGFAPPNDLKANVNHVLDVGTGTGIWAIDYADKHPGAEVIGIDLSPIQPTFVPPNVQFIIDDIEDEWQYSYLFDYIHSRMMNSSIADWESYATKTFENLEPGGYVEFQEIDVLVKADDHTLEEQNSLSRWGRLLHDASVKLGRAYFDPGNIKEVLGKVGFEDVTEAKFKWPTNSWPRDKKHKELGLWNNENAKFFLEAVALAPLTRALGWSREEVAVFLTQARKELNDPKIHAYWPM